MEDREQGTRFQLFVRHNKTDLGDVARNPREIARVPTCWISNCEVLLKGTVDRFPPRAEGWKSGAESEISCIIKIKVWQKCLPTRLPDGRNSRTVGQRAYKVASYVRAFSLRIATSDVESYSTLKLR